MYLKKFIYFKKALLLRIIIGLFIPIIILSQQATKDVVYLKNGSIIKGEIIEMIPNESISIKSSLGNIYVYKMAEVEKITKGELDSKNYNIPKSNPNDNQLQMQNNNLRFAVYGLMSLPIGDFNDVQGLNTGFGVNAEIAMPFKVPGLEWVSNVSFIYNGYNLSTDEVSRMFGLIYDYDVSTGNWYNLPISSGLRYSSNISPTIDIFGSFQLSFNFSLPPSIDGTRTTDGKVYTIHTDMNNPTSLGFNIAGGMTINRKYDVGVKYLALGKHKFKGELIYTASSPDNLDNETSISIFAIFIGVRF